jgi:CheY-like chemotaxis protein
MGGGIGVETAPGRGSSFFFDIHAPAVEMAAAEDLEAGSPTTLCGVRVLVADDNAFNREIARAILEQFDADVTEAEDGREAARLAATAPFDVMLIDIHMPVLDGIGALQCIRTGPGPNRDTPAFAFTADLPHTVNCGMDGFDGVIAKPIKPADMIAAVVQAAQGPPAEDETATPLAVGL